MNLEEAARNIGRPVLYGMQAEVGIISWVGELYVFVFFDGRPTAVSCRAEDLDLLDICICVEPSHECYCPDWRLPS